MQATRSQGINAMSVRVTYVGHATVLLEAKGRAIVTDPVLRARVGYLVRRAAAATALPEVDAALVSHVHHDHFDGPSLWRLGRGIQVVAPSGAAPLLRRRRLRQVTELAPGERTEIGDVVVEATLAEHETVRYPGTRPVMAIGFLIDIGPRVYFAGDTDLFDGMTEIGDRGIDVALVPVAGWGPRIPAGHLDPAKAAEAVRRLRPRVAIPIHWGTLAAAWMARTDAATRREPAETFAAAVAQLAPDVEVRILEPGESATL